MYPTINGKSFMDCTEEDLQVLLENPDYRENEYIDYKRNFSFLEMDKRNPKRLEHIAEFRSDVCAFANAGGGYLIFGISDENGMAKEIVGIDIDANNTDRFELDRKNNLSPILPKIPSIQFKFVPLINNRYVVILFVRRDAYTPYVHIEEEKNYKIYKRVGNGKTTMAYLELKNMFNQSLSIEEAVQEYRQKRIDFFRNQEDTEDCRYSKFLLLHIIPDTFVDSTYRKNLFVWTKQNPGHGFSRIFSEASCTEGIKPSVDGLRFLSYHNDAEGLLNNNGIAECYWVVSKYIRALDRFTDGYFPSQYFLEMIQGIVNEYIVRMRPILETKRLFIALSLVGCKGLVTEVGTWTSQQSSIDRNTIICNPITIEDIDDEDGVSKAMKWLQIEFALSLGISDNAKLQQLIKEVSVSDSN